MPHPRARPKKSPYHPGQKKMTLPTVVTVPSMEQLRALEQILTGQEAAIRAMKGRLDAQESLLLSQQEIIVQQEKTIGMMLKSIGILLELEKARKESTSVPPPKNIGVSEVG